jgi:hypothetical protein
MKKLYRSVWRQIALGLLGSLAASTPSVLPAQDPAVKNAYAATNLVPLKLDLPAAHATGTPKPVQTNSYTDPFPDKQPPVPLVPPGLKNIARDAKLSCSDKNAASDALAKIVDGDKGHSEDSIVCLRKGTQWVQMDFGSPREIFAIALWHAHNANKVYHDVIVQAANDPDFTKDVRTLFNNDHENAAGLGVGTDREYFETHFGKTIGANGVKARYLRFYSKGSTECALNEYTEIEVYGRPAR